MNRSLAALGLAALISISAACGDDSPGADETVPADASTTAPTAPGIAEPATVPAETVPAIDPVDGRWFVGDASSITGHPLVEGTELSIRFDANEVIASTGCNTLQGAYTIDGTSMLVLDDISSTAMGCDAALHEQDEWLSTFLRSRPAIRVDGPALLLSGDSVGIVLTDREVAEPDRQLEGNTWTLESQISGETQSHSSLAALATLSFADGVLSVETGCNTGSAAYELGDGTVTVQPVALTRMACDDATMQQEAAVVAVLDGTMTYEIDAGRLTLRNGPNGLVLTTG